MGHLWYTELGNTAGSLTNTGDFLNIQTDPAVLTFLYWSGTELASDPRFAWDFRSYDGAQDHHHKSLEVSAMAVRDGDVLATQVPEPKSFLLALTALGALALVRRRRTV